jgi:WD40 repeat protein
MLQHDPDISIGSVETSHARKKRLGRFVLRGLLFCVILPAAYSYETIRPYAVLDIGNEGHFICFSPDGKSLITAGKDDFSTHAGPLRMWDLERGLERFCVAADWEHIETVHFSPDSSVFAAHEQNRELKLWSASNGEEIGVLDTQTRFGNWVSFRFSPDGTAIVFKDFSKEKEFGEDGITFWNISGRKEVSSIGCYFGTLAFGLDGRTFATFTRKNHEKINRIMLWRWESPTAAPTLIHEHTITADYVAFSPDLTTFATASDLPDGKGEMALWNMASGTKRGTLTFAEPSTHLQSLSFNANGRILSATGGGGTQLDYHWQTTTWDVSGDEPKQIAATEVIPTVSQDGRWLAIPLERGVSLLDRSVGAGIEIQNLVKQESRELATDDDVTSSYSSMYNFHKVYPRPVLSPDGEIVVVTGLISQGKPSLLANVLPAKWNPFPDDPWGSTVRIWDANSGKHVLSVDRCHDAHFSADGRVLATLHHGSLVKLWQVPLRKPYWRILGWTVVIWVGVLLLFECGRRLVARASRPIAS